MKKSFIGLALGFLILLSGSAWADASPHDDEFTASTLDPAWHWVREVPDHWSLAPAPGYLRIITQVKDLFRSSNNAPVLLQSAPYGDFELTTRIVMMATSNCQQGGLIAYGDDDNYVRLTYGFICFQRNFELGKEVGGDFQAVAVPPPAGNSFYLRLVKAGQTYIGYYSQDGSTWTQIGMHAGVSITVSQVGLTAFNGVGQPLCPEIPADFDFFHVKYLNYIFLPLVVGGN